MPTLMNRANFFSWVTTSSRYTLLVWLLVAASSTLANPEKPGGAVTLPNLLGSKSFSQPAPDMTLEQRMTFNLGRSIFTKLWVSSPASTTASDGLGPLYNARSCLQCHANNGRGHPPEPDSDRPHSISLLLRMSIPAQDEHQQAQLDQGQLGFIPEPVYGGQLQDQSVQGLAAEGRVQVQYSDQTVEFPDGEIVTLRQPHYHITALAYGELHKDLRLSARVAPPMHGLGLLEAIPEAELQKNVEQQQELFISGRLNQVWDIQHQKTAVGRFGWKASHPSLKQQNAAAMIEDMGISSDLFPQGYGGCTASQDHCRRLPDGNSPHLDGVEASVAMTEVLEFYTRTLAVPPRRHQQHPDVLAGEKLFHQTGCQSCHRPSYTTRLDANPLLAGQTIWPYTDLLLHDMGAGLADQHSEFLASGAEWRTPPLWGIGLTAVVSGHTQLLHDGRARNVQEAILWHGGEAEQVKQAFMNLPQQQRQQLIQFVESL